MLTRTMNIMQVSGIRGLIDMKSTIVDIKLDKPSMKGYFTYHYGLSKGLWNKLNLREDWGIDVIFIQRKGSIESLCKKIQSFWKTTRKVKGKHKYAEIKNRSILFMTQDLESAKHMRHHYFEKMDGQQTLNLEDL